MGSGTEKQVTKRKGGGETCKKKASSIITGRDTFKAHKAHGSALGLIVPNGLITHSITFQDQRAARQALPQIRKYLVPALPHFLLLSLQKSQQNPLHASPGRASCSLGSAVHKRVESTSSGSPTKVMHRSPAPGWQTPARPHKPAPVVSCSKYVKRLPSLMVFVLTCCIIRTVTQQSVNCRIIPNT